MYSRECLYKNLKLVLQPEIIDEMGVGVLYTDFASRKVVFVTDKAFCPCVIQWYSCVCVSVVVLDGAGVKGEPGEWVRSILISPCYFCVELWAHSNEVSLEERHSNDLEVLELILSDRFQAGFL